MIYYLKNKYLSLAVNSDGGGMTSINYRGEERQWQGGEFWKGQDVVLFPIVGHAGEYEVGGTLYKVTSIFAEKGSLREIYEDLIITMCSAAGEKP